MSVDDLASWQVTALRAYWYVRLRFWDGLVYVLRTWLRLYLYVIAAMTAALWAILIGWLLRFGWRELLLQFRQ